ncbi:MAG: hypothetical protein WBB43_17855 [Limnoraphis sp.]
MACVGNIYRGWVERKQHPTYLINTPSDRLSKVGWVEVRNPTLLDFARRAIANFHFF